MYKTLLVLGLLRARPLHGYEIHRIVRSHGDVYTDLKKTNLYYLLDRLAGDGYLEVQVEPNAHGMRGERRTYTITERGRGYFEELMKGIARTYEPIHTGIDAAVILLEHLSQKEAIVLLDERYSIVASRREQVARELRDSSSQNLLEFIASDHLLARIEAELAWINRSLQRLWEAEGNIKLAQQRVAPSSTDHYQAEEE